VQVPPIIEALFFASMKNEYESQSAMTENPNNPFAARTSPMTLLGNHKCFYSKDLCASKARLSTSNQRSATVENIRQITPYRAEQTQFTHTPNLFNSFIQKELPNFSCLAERKNKPNSNPIKPDPKNAKKSHNSLSDRHIQQQNRPRPAKKQTQFKPNAENSHNHL
jgi:hypothetical protein